MTLSVLLTACSGRSETGSDRPTLGAEPTAEPIVNLDPFRTPIAQQLVDDGWAAELFLGDPGEQLLQSTLEKVEVLKALRVSGLVFALFAIDTGTGSGEHGIAWLSRSQQDWDVQELHLGDEASFRPIPEGSNGSSLLPILAERQAGFGGFVDPTVTRVEMVDPRLRVVDADIPSNGATVFLASVWGQIRYYRGDTIVGAVPVSGEESPAPATYLDEEAREVADAFVEAMLSGEWEAAATLFAPGTRAIALLPPLEDVLNAAPHRRSGRPKAVRYAFFYGLERSPDSATLQVSMTDQSGDWKVFSYGYRADSPLDNPGNFAA
jgi:hypothetical protein